MPGETLMHDVTATAAPQRELLAQKNPRYAEHYRRYPTIDYLRRGARRRLPHFSFEYGDGGSGKDDAGIKRNWAALDAVELVPRYGVMPSLPPCDVELFGRRCGAPTGIWRAPRNARAFPMYSAWRAAPPSKRSRRSRRMCAGFSSTARRTT